MQFGAYTGLTRGRVSRTGQFAVTIATATLRDIATHSGQVCNIAGLCADRGTTTDWRKPPRIISTT